MDKRRRMLLSGKVKPLTVFAFGDTFLQNGNMVAQNGNSFENGLLLVNKFYNRLLEEYVGGFLDISGIDFSKYKTLNIECMTGVMDYSSYYTYFYAGYGERTGMGRGSYSEFNYAPQSYRVLSFDISSVRGERYIKASANNTGTAGVRIKNIWLE